MSTAVENATVEIDLQGRWDALELSQRLSPFHSFLVQYNPGRWVVRAQAPGSHGERLDRALGIIQEWLDERRVEDTSMRINGRPYSAFPPQGPGVTLPASSPAPP
jgi:hypothetical protein